MAAAKKPIPLPSPTSRLAKTALLVALTALQDERVRTQLMRAPGAVRAWAEQHREGSGRSWRDLDPSQRFGRRGLERRLEALQRNVAIVFPAGSDPAAIAIYRAIDELDRAAAVSATMPVLKRRSAHARIGEGIDQLESALVDAVLPGPA
jgi:hypothetical protein